MNLKPYKERFINNFKEVYGVGESYSMWRILKEDLLDSLDTKRNLDTLFEGAVARLKKGEPIQYIVKNARFLEHDFFVNNAVLIPRPETEELVVWIQKKMNSYSRALKILDIGTGSGCIIISLALCHVNHEYHGIDISNAALEVASTNGENLGARVSFSQIDFSNKELWPKLGKYDLIISNPPYVSDAEEEHVSDSALNHEPREAVFSGTDPLLFYQLIEEFALTHLSEDGMLFLEMNEFHTEKIAQIYTQNYQIEIQKDLQGKERMLKAWR